MEQFAFECQLESLANDLHLPVNQLSEDQLSGIVFSDMVAIMKKKVPTLWCLLRKLAYSEVQEKRNTCKNPDKVGQSPLLPGWANFGSLPGCPHDNIDALI